MTSPVVPDPEDDQIGPLDPLPLTPQEQLAIDQVRSEFQKQFNASALDPYPPARRVKLLAVTVLVVIVALVIPLWLAPLVLKPKAAKISARAAQTYLNDYAIYMTTSTPSPAAVSFVRQNATATTLSSSGVMYALWGDSTCYGVVIDSTHASPVAPVANKYCHQG